ncbi:MAG: hypothetical protein DHS20C17_06210 [Cyclobacteriaceae bacterium]|nr:MAG: hypothetical protein DHS20C17_06210 [Cyclobacteriaceae bacterium]
MNRYFELLRKHSNYEKFFIATDDHTVLNHLIGEFGKDRLIFQEAIRSHDQKGVHTDDTIKDRYRLGLEVLADCYALSVCKKALLVHSNVSYGALLLNPELPYLLLETRMSMFSRWKTNLVYQLDRLGVRKM